MLPITLKPKECGIRPLKKRSDWDLILEAILRFMGRVKESLKKTHDSWKMSLVTLKHTKCVKELLK